MATGIASAIAAAILDAYCRSVAWTEPAAFYVKLHTADPGADGTNAPFGDTTRKAATFGAASGGVISNSAALDWTNLSAAGTISHVSFWETVGPAGGTFLGSDDLVTPRTVAIGDNFSIPIGDLDITLGAVAA